ncbi:unnamed protein product [Didymodactylos carnosus]|uniref:Uncharacterized protein n=1 Tax=Didymodactylos carnosus TaxID=1234261 RepID=A0A813SLT0_9BILA|nr:unnamed protein product [Didymodactylos carnosus]CAF0796326.1 unnamed protein product [Didymodactylos carnosus]CAF3511156.1 unnamed protein product [Didymodactylos carnosus]CAF3580940.1 unnamed protein product [Didymodactylos carnosus]
MSITSKSVKVRNYSIAFVVGIITGIAWWIEIDILSRSKPKEFDRRNIIPAAFITLMLFILHFIPDVVLQTDDGIFGGRNDRYCYNSKCAQISLFVVFIIIFCGVAASIWIFVTDYAIKTKPEKKGSVMWFGAGNMLTCLLLTIAALLGRFGRRESESMIF